MVKVTPVNENEKKFNEAAAAAENNADYSDTESEISDESDDEEDIDSETLTDRLVALKDIVPPQYRSNLVTSASTAYNWASKSVSYGGKALWVLTTSGLLLAVPLALSIISEQQLMEMEKEMKMSQTANDVLAPGADTGFSQQQQQQEAIGESK